MKRLLSYMSALMFLLSCSSGKLEPDGGYGRIHVKLSADAESAIELKASVALSPDQSSNYTIKLFEDDGKIVDGTPVLYRDITEPLVVPLNASYYVTAESCSEDEAEKDEAGKFGCPRYAGSSDVFRMSTSNISEVASIYCSQTNAVVAVEFDSSVKERFEGLSVSLSTDANPQRVLNFAESDTSAKAYFNPSTLSYAITGTYIKTQKPIDMSGTRMLSAKDNVIISIKLDMTHGQAGVPVIEVIEGFGQNVDQDCGIDPYK